MTQGMKFAGQRALVTGGTQGVGKAVTAWRRVRIHEI